MTIPTIIYLTPLSTPRILYGEKTYKIAFPQEGDVPAIADVKEVVRTVGGEQAIEIRLRKFQNDVRYLHGLRQELLRKYLDQWVAVYDQSLVAHASTLPKLRKSLAKKGIQQNETAIDYVSSKRRVMLL